MDSSLPATAQESTAFYRARQTLVSSEAVKAEVAWSETAPRDRACEIHSPVRQLLFPIGSGFAMRAGGREAVCDSNQVVLVPPGLVARDRLLGNEGPRAVILSLGDAHLDELLAAFGKRAEWSRVFGRLTLPASPHVQQLAAVLNGGASADRLLLEEAALELVRAVFGVSEARGTDVGVRPRRLVDKVKEMLAQSSERLSLDAIGRALNASPVYLTELFRRVEGMPISRYQRQLRLARALTLLPGATDITGLALDLGFSSHSHFSTAFRAVHGMTPSAHRARWHRVNRGG
jgi:AraC family transcriptional regulator